MRFYWLALGGLALWRVTHLINAEDGPWDLLARLRQRAGSGFWGNLLDCFYCLSLWLAVPFAFLVGEGWRERLVLWPALSAGSILLERWSSPKPTPAPYMEDEGNALLREAAPATPERDSTATGPRTDRS
jgi:hypothetical protein